MLCNIGKQSIGYGTCRGLNCGKSTSNLWQNEQDYFFPACSLKCAIDHNDFMNELKQKQKQKQKQIKEDN